MKTFRPFVAEDDSFLSKIIKYIPTEVIAAYTTVVGLLKQNLGANLPDKSLVNIYFVVLVFITCFTPVWTFFAVKDKPNVNEPSSLPRRAVFHSVIATVSFIIWVYSIGDILFKSWLCKCYMGDTLECFDKSGRYNPAIGSIVLFLYTVLVPLLERIILGKPNVPISKN